MRTFNERLDLLPTDKPIIYRAVHIHNYGPYWYALWDDNTSEYGIHFHYLGKDDEHGTLAARASENRPHYRRYAEQSCEHEEIRLSCRACINRAYARLAWKLQQTEEKSA